MLKVYKYKLDDRVFWVEAPVVNWLYVDWQEREGCYCAWALIDVDLPQRRFQFIELYTGASVDNDLLKGYKYLGTVNRDYLVSHWFVAEYDCNNEVMFIGDQDVSE